MFVLIAGVLSGLLGTIIALRLMAIDEKETPSTLTRRGKIVVGILCGIGVAVVVILINGMWWNCDLNAGSKGQCSLLWTL